jgi:hypothetical protein
MHNSIFHADHALTPLEEASQAILSIENRERYVRQSKATKTGALAELPSREPLQLIADDERAPS